MNRDDSDFLVRKPPNRVRGQRENEIYGEITTIGIEPCPDPSVLFEEFARRFSVVPLDEEYDGIPRPLAQIAEIGKGNFDELALVLASLFSWNGLDTEFVHVWSNREAQHGHHELGKLEHLLVYLPALDRYFDPTSHMSAQLTETGIAPWLEEKPRVYCRYPSELGAYSSHDMGRGYYGKRYTHYPKYSLTGFRPRKRLDSDFFLRMFPSSMGRQREGEILRGITTIGIGPSSDPSVLFHEFAKHFSVVPTEEEYDGIPRPFAQIAETGKGNRDELAVMLASLFVRNGIDTEYVQVWSNREARWGHRELGELEHILVYVPALDRYFDPTSRMSAQLTEAGMERWLEEQPRVYFRYPSDNTARGYYGKRYTHHTRHTLTK
jgi:hypothetical protein